MSEPTNAEMAEQEDLRLDAQIDELMEARYYAATGNLPDSPEEAPDPEPPPLHPWYEDIGECVAFARWYWAGPNFSGRSQTAEILDFFEKPCEFEKEYVGYKVTNL